MGRKLLGKIQRVPRFLNLVYDELENYVLECEGGLTMT